MVTASDAERELDARAPCLWRRRWRSSHDETDAGEGPGEWGLGTHTAASACDPVLLGPVLAALGLAACAGVTATATPLPTWPVQPEQLPDPASGSADASLTCGNRTFPAAGLAAPTGAEKASGPEFDALRAALTQFGSEFPGSPGWTWQLAGRDDTGAIFLASTDAAGSNAWVSVEVSADANGWKPDGMGQCEPRVVPSAEFGPATWAVDPSFAPPTAAATQLHILVWEGTCSSGSPATGRISAPIVQYAAASVTITLGVRPLPASPGTVFTCPVPPGTPATMNLAEPLGNRTLLDGGLVPPAPPSPAND